MSKAPSANELGNKNKNNSVEIKLGEQSIAHEAGETILETLERGNLEPQFNCREGYCGVCRTTLLTGSVEYILDPLAFIDDDEILTCCTIPTSSIDIKINY